MERKQIKCDIDGLIHALQLIKKDYGNISVFAQFREELLWLHNLRVETAGDIEAVIISIDHNPFILSDGRVISSETH